jgi:hypothetical protein
MEVNYRTVTPAFNSGIVRNAMRAYPNEFRCYRGNAQGSHSRASTRGLDQNPQY